MDVLLLTLLRLSGTRCRPTRELLPPSKVWKSRLIKSVVLPVPPKVRLDKRDEFTGNFMLVRVTTAAPDTLTVLITLGDERLLSLSMIPVLM